MSAYLRQRKEALDLVLTTQPIAHVVAEGMRLVSKTNGAKGTSRAWMFARARDVKKQREEGWWLGQCLGPEKLKRAMFAAVLITRVGPRPIDSDNLEACAKNVRDGIAWGLGVDDGDPFIRYVCDQEKGPYAVRAALFARWK